MKGSQTQRGDVMNPPEPAAQGSEAGNLDTPHRDGTGAVPGREAMGTEAQAGPAVTADSARELAIGYVSKLLGQGYTPEKADAEYCRGHSGIGDQDGYEIRKGRIRAPAFGPHYFNFRELAEEVRAVQQHNGDQ